MPPISRELMAKLAVKAAPGFNLFSIQPPIPKRPSGRIAKLPPEILLLILKFLDLQSLCRLSRASSWARLLVFDFRPYREIIELTPTLPQTLARARLVSTFSAHYIFRRVLCSDRCSSCCRFGAFVFLLTCERVCPDCLVENDESFQVIEKSLAMSIFQLHHEQLATVPAYYCTWQKLSFVRTIAIKEIAVMANAPVSLFAALGLDKKFIGYCSKKMNSTATCVPFSVRG